MSSDSLLWSRMQQLRDLHPKIFAEHVRHIHQAADTEACACAVEPVSSRFRNLPSDYSSADPVVSAVCDVRYMATCLSSRFVDSYEDILEEEAEILADLLTHGQRTWSSMLAWNLAIASMLAYSGAKSRTYLMRSVFSPCGLDAPR